MSVRAVSLGNFNIQQVKAVSLSRFYIQQVQPVSLGRFYILSVKAATFTTSTSFELVFSHARVTSIKFTKQEGVSE